MRPLIWMTLTVFTVLILVITINSQVPIKRSVEFNARALEAFDSISLFERHLFDAQAPLLEIEAEKAINVVQHTANTPIEGNISDVLSMYFRSVRFHEIYSEQQRNRAFMDAFQVVH